MFLPVMTTQRFFSSTSRRANSSTQPRRGLLCLDELVDDGIGESSLLLLLEEDDAMVASFLWRAKELLPTFDYFDSMTFKMSF